MKDHLINLARGLLWRHPRLYRPIGLLRRGADVFDLDYDLAVEGYPRSANTFVANLLKITQPQLRIRSHRHIPPHAIAAVQAGLPVLLLIRPPVDCVSSFAIQVETPARPQLAYYVAYHEVMRPYLGQMFIADFAAVTGDPQAVLREFAAHYHLPLQFEGDFDQLRTAALQKIDRDHESETGGGINLRNINRPTPERTLWKARLVEEIQQPENRPWLHRAEALYAEFRAKAGGRVK